MKEAADAGADAYSFAPGLCWLLWWPSEEFPAGEHIRWYVQEFQGKHTTESYYDYAFNNPAGVYGEVYHDIIQKQIDSCRKYGLAAILSYRMNDAHFSQRADKVRSNMRYSHSTISWGARISAHSIPSGRCPS